MNATNPNPRWYCLSKSGMATLCVDQQDAIATAKDADTHFPREAPHRAVQLVEHAPHTEQNLEETRMTQHTLHDLIHASGVSEPLRQGVQALCKDYEKLMAENEALRQDAERYRWLKSAKFLELNSGNGEWFREDGSRFVSSHRLCAFDTVFSAFPTLDETIDAAMKGQA